MEDSVLSRVFFYLGLIVTLLVTLAMSVWLKKRLDLELKRTDGYTLQPMMRERSSEQLSYTKARISPTSGNVSVILTTAGDATASAAAAADGGGLAPLK